MIKKKNILVVVSYHIHKFLKRKKKRKINGTTVPTTVAHIIGLNVCKRKGLFKSFEKEYFVGCVKPYSPTTTIITAHDIVFNFCGIDVLTPPVRYSVVNFGKVREVIQLVQLHQSKYILILF